MNPTSIIIFGASGDLTARKLMPALFNNFKKGRLPASTKIYGFALADFSDGAFREKMQQAIKEFAPKVFDAEKWQAFASSLYYVRGDLTRKEVYRALDQKIKQNSGEADNRLYYLATAPRFFPAAASWLGENGMAREMPDSGFRRLVVEKPFGRDLASAKALNAQVHDTFHEHQIYRIDHYLGKETVQNLLVFRFANAIYEPIWNRNYVDHVQITVAESVGVGHRAEYYDKAGVLRDMFQNHLLQLLTLIAMEPPHKYDAVALRNKKVEVLSALRPIEEEKIAALTVRAQYQGYQREPNVEQFSTTPTFAALKVFIDNWRWQDVPFYLRSGKNLAEKTSEITIQFRLPPQKLFRGDGPCEIESNRLSICVQPDEGFHLRFATKIPDKGMQVKPVDMNFHYHDSFGEEALPEAYERLLLDALNGDAALFARSDEIELAWTFIDGIHQGWKSDYAPPMATYEPGSWGPQAAEALLSRDKRRWLYHCGRH